MIISFNSRASEAWEGLTDKEGSSTGLQDGWGDFRVRIRLKRELRARVQVVRGLRVRIRLGRARKRAKRSERAL
jgi:hypothetical protein